MHHLNSRICEKEEGEGRGGSFPQRGAHKAALTRPRFIEHAAGYLFPYLGPLSLRGIMRFSRLKC